MEVTCTSSRTKLELQLNYRKIILNKPQKTVTKDLQKKPMETGRKGRDTKRAGPTPMGAG